MSKSLEVEKKRVTIVGAGPSGLFCAYLLLKEGFQVDLYDHSSGPAKKFIVAGSGGLNLTHSENLTSFNERYGKDSELFKGLLEGFSPADLRQWCSDLGIETFVGSSARVFPKSFKAAEVLSKWLDALKSYEGFRLKLKHKLVGIEQDKTLEFLSEGQRLSVKAQTIILALGGASWKKTGSDGLWDDLLVSLGIELKPFLPMNCGFEREWSDFFKKEVGYSPLKNIAVSFEETTIKGELMLTSFGLEGGAIYALSHRIRDRLGEGKEAVISIDLKPSLSLEAITQKLAKRAKKTTLSNHLRRALNFDKKTFILLKELLESSDFEDMAFLARKIKRLEIRLTAARPIDEAISTSGGVCFSGLTQFLESDKREDIYFAGEMLDFEAPTGGYLLQGCFSTSWRVVQGIKNKVLV